MNYKPLLSSAPAKSILNAGFQYTNSAATDIRKTFAKARRNLSTRPAAAAAGPQSKSPAAIVPARRPSDRTFGSLTRERAAPIKADRK